MKDHYQILIVGGGSAGITVAARLTNESNGDYDIGIIEPNEKHYYQPLWTLVGAGVFPAKNQSAMNGDLIPYGNDWIQDRVATFDPDNNTVTTESGNTIGYDYLVVTAGIQIDWDAIPGLKESVANRERAFAATIRMKPSIQPGTTFAASKAARRSLHSRVRV